MSHSDEATHPPPRPSAADDHPLSHALSGHDETSRFLPPSLHIGIAEIDSQHATLFRRLVWLKRQCLQNNFLSADDAESLLAYLRGHFLTEEQYAGEANLDFSGHARRHQEMLDNVARALHAAVAGQADVYGVLRYIEYWFERHIVHEDMRLGAICSTHQATPAFVAPGPGQSPSLGA